MRDSRLSYLNFQELLDYGGQPPVRNEYDPSLCCRGYCVSCEKNGLLEKTGGRLDLMSHGCDSADFESILGPMPRKGVSVEQPVLFLLENPGRDYKNGKPVEFQGYQKQPPVNVYYWTDIECWPHDLTQFKGNFYGPYFAYLMWRHQLLNVYITNLIKCKWDNGNARKTPTPIIEHCTERHLKREVQFFAPKLVFCFGRAAKNGCEEFFRREKLNCPAVYLYHPSFIRDRYQTGGKTQQELIQENDDSAKEALKALVNST